MRPVVTRYLIPAAALLATFAVSLLLVFVVASALDGASDGDNAAGSPPTMQTLTANVTATEAPPPPASSATRVAIAALLCLAVTKDP